MVLVAPVAGERLRVLADRMSVGVSGVLKRNFSTDWLSVPVEELPLRVDVQPPAGPIVSIALDPGTFVLPLVAAGFTSQSCFDGGIVSVVLDLFGGESWGWLLVTLGFQLLILLDIVLR